MTGCRVNVDDCAATAHDLPLLVDGELAEGERLRVERHLDGCPACGAVVERARRLKRTLQRAGETTGAPSALRSRLSASLACEAPPASCGRAPLWRRPTPLAAAGATVLGVAAWAWFLNGGEDLTQDAVARHTRPLPPEFRSSDARATEAWASDKVPFRFRVPQPPRPDLALLGARLSHVREHSAVQLFYGAGQPTRPRASVMVYVDPAGHTLMRGRVERVDDRDVFLDQASGFNVGLWKNDEVVYGLIADSPEDVVELVRAVAR
jgi:anti-sigma factor RsiW